MKLSIIVPCKNEEDNVEELYSKINEVLNKIKYEIIFIDDGSSDKTFERLSDLYEKDIKHVKVLYSTEQPVDVENKDTVGTVSYMPSMAGLLIASQVIRDLAELD